MDKRWAAGLGVAAAVLLLAALFGADRIKDNDDGRAADGPSKDGTPLLSEPVAETPPGSVVTAKTPRLSAAARSVAFEGRILDVGRIDLHVTDLRVIADVADAQGKTIGEGTLTASGGIVAVEGQGLAVDAAFTATPGTLNLTAGSLVVDGDATVSAPKLTLRTTEQPEGMALASPVRIRSTASIDFDGRAVLSKPDLELTKGSGNRATLSWAGGGRIEVPKEPAFAGEWLGVKATKLAVQLRLSDLRLEGTFDAQQVYVDGLPRLKADKVGVDLPFPPAPVVAGSRGSFSWAPRNRSSYDMAITKIGPGNPQGAWVNLALDALPRMFGGENRTPAGGDTTGLAKRGSGGFFGSRSASPIDAVILPGTADLESITFDVPAGTPPGRYEIVLVLEGNFDPVRAVIPFDVVPPGQQPQEPPPPDS